MERIFVPVHEYKLIKQMSKHMSQELAEFLWKQYSINEDMKQFFKDLKGVKNAIPKESYEKLKKVKDPEEAKDILLCRLFDGNQTSGEEWLYHKLIF